MYIRFVVDAPDRLSGKRKGLFAAMGVLNRMEVMSNEDHNKYREIADWFNTNLDMPTDFTRSKKPHAKPRAISWFKDSAKEYISRTREVACILEKYGFVVTMLKTNKSGYIVYDSVNQIVAEPFTDTPA